MTRILIISANIVHVIIKRCVLFRSKYKSFLFQINMKISTLDLSHNHLGRKGVEYVRKMMIENDTITTLVR